VGTGSQRPFLFGTNFKMHQTPADSARFVRELVTEPLDRGGARLFLIPPFTSLPAVVDEARRAKAEFWIGAQNMHWAAEGAYTGEISAPMLVALGVDLVLVGHAERRSAFHETDAEVQLKVRAALAAGLRVLLCVGETGEERSYGIGAEIVIRQLKVALHGVDSAAVGMLQIAYEPVWSIGEGGVPAHPEDVEPVAAFIRATLVERFGPAGEPIPVLYGGSVNPENATRFAALPGIGGLFVGRAAWTVEGFRATLAAGIEGACSRFA
jgi:triosephosphate isomerase